MPMYPKLSDMVPMPSPRKWDKVEWYYNKQMFGFKHTEASAYFDHKAYWDAIEGRLRT